MTKLTRAIAGMVLGCWLVLLGGCNGGAEQSIELARYGGFEGVWLSNGEVEAFVSARPMVRVVAYRPVGGESVLHIHPQHIEYSGVRTQFLEPRQNPLSGVPAAQPGRVIAREPGRAVVLAEPSAEAGLQAGMDVSLAESGSALTIRHFLVNTGAKPREIAPWAIVAVPRRGRAVIPFSRILPADAPPRPFRTVIFVPKRNPRDQALVFGQFAMGVRFRPRDKSIKVGIRSEAGWSAWVDGATVLSVHADFQPREVYSEGGANVTCYVGSGDDQAAWGELENNGPLTVIHPGQRAWLVQHLGLQSYDEPLPDEPDKVLQRIAADVVTAGP